MHVGVVLPQAGKDWSSALESAQHAEEIGADSVWVVDHLIGFPPERGILEAWTMLSALATATTRVQLGAQVFCQSFRNPALFAKMAATLDQISGGRVRLLVGAGWHEAEYMQFGYEFPEPSIRVEQTDETIQILKGMLSGADSFSFEGQHYRVNDVSNIPQPVRVPLPIEVGAARNRMLRLIARRGDGWNCPGAALPVFDDRLEYLKQACEKNGRSIKDLVLSCQIPCAVGDDEAAKHPRLQAFSPQLGLIGSVDRATERAGELMQKGLTDFLTIVPPGPSGQKCLERLVAEVRPQLK
jgi:alkanesulfonate monooxygenase SsuD/methylene tetrahydromethanopterin reductase-like flavin-dependent oxidoreductase (luciferase family)